MARLRELDDDDEEWPYQELSRRGKAAVTALMLLCVALVGGLWIRPFDIARGNPTLNPARTSNTDARVVGGCSTTDERNLISCVQYVDFDAGTVKVRHAPVRVIDEYRRDHENDRAVPVLFDKTDPTRFRLLLGNPGPVRRVVGTVFLTGASIAVGALLGLVLILTGMGGRKLWHRASA